MKCRGEVSCLGCLLQQGALELQAPFEGERKAQPIVPSSPVFLFLFSLDIEIVF